MTNISTSSLEPISALPRDYASFLRRTQRKREPVVFLKQNKPVAALLSWSLLQELMELKRQSEERKALSDIRRSEKEYRSGKAKVLKSLASLE